MRPDHGNDRLLRELSGRGRAHWSLSTLLMLLLALAVGLLYLGEVSSGVPFLPESSSRPLLIGALVVFLAAFSAYAFVQQRSLERLMGSLLETRGRESSLDLRLAEISSLFEVAATLHLQLDLRLVLSVVTERLLPPLAADEASIMLLDEARGELRCLAVSGADVEFVREASVRVGEGIAGRVAASGEPLVIHDSDVDLRFPGSAKRERRIGSALCVPLRLDGRTVGVLNVTRLETRPAFEEQDARLVLSFADHLAITVQRIRDFDALGRRASAFERMHRLRREFLCAVNHELRNPLASIMGFSELLVRDDGAVGPNERVAFTRAILEQGRRMQESVDDLHALYSLEASAVTFEPAPGSLNQLASDSVHAIAGRARRKQIVLATELDRDLPYVLMDHGKLHAAVRHLLAGAVRVSAPSSPVTLRTRLEPEPDGAERAVLEVHVAADAGSAVFGMPDSGDPAADPSAGHADALGWGLVLIRELVELHGGRLEARREPAGSLLLAMSLPTAADDEARRAA